MREALFRPPTQDARGKTRDLVSRTRETKKRRRPPIGHCMRTHRLTQEQSDRRRSQVAPRRSKLRSSKVTWRGRERNGDTASLIGRTSEKHRCRQMIEGLHHGVTSGEQSTTVFVPHGKRRGSQRHGCSVLNQASFGLSIMISTVLEIVP